MKFHGMIREVDLLRSRIAELEDGACRFDCRKQKEAFIAGYKYGYDELDFASFEEDWIAGYKTWKAVGE